MDIIYKYAEEEEWHILLEKMVMEGCQQKDFLFFPEFSKSTRNLYTSCGLFWFCDNFCLTILSFMKHKLPQNNYLLDKSMFFFAYSEKLHSCIFATLPLGQQYIALLHSADNVSTRYKHYRDM
jgi:hypothetical protein